MIELNDLAFQNADALEAIDAAPNEQLTIAALATQIDRDPANLRKTLKRLTAEGILNEPALAGLTAKGEEQLRAIRRARSEAEGVADAAPTRWPLAQVKPNPANRPIDPATLPDLAESIIGAEDVIQPVVLTPVDDDGHRMLLAGERRWRACLLLRDEGRLLPALAEGLPFVERAVTRAQALLIMAIENNQREDISPWEDAKLLALLADEFNGNATEVARRLGRLKESDGKRAGLRDVQWKIKTAKEATPDAIAAYEADPDAPGAWERLRDSVTKPQGPTNPHLALFIVEAALKAEQEAGVWDAALWLRKGLQWPEGWLGKWFGYDEASGRLGLSKASTDWLADEGLGDDEADTVLTRHRAKAGRPHRTGREPWVSEILNPQETETPPAEDESDPCVYRGVRYPNATHAAEARRIAEGQRVHVAPPARSAADSGQVPQDRSQLALAMGAKPAEDERPNLNARQTCALVELAHKTHAVGFNLDGGERAVTVGKFWLSSLANDLVHARLVRFVQLPGKPPIGVITERGKAWLIEGAHAHGDDLRVTPLALDDIQTAAAGHPFEGSYFTDWIGEEVAAPGTLADAAEGEQTDVEDAAKASADSDAAEVLARARAFIARGVSTDPFYRHELGQLLDSVHASAPIHAEADGVVVNGRDEVLFTYDQHADLPADLAQAGAELTAHLVNVVLRGDVPLAREVEMERPVAGETLAASVTRICQPIRDLMARHYDALHRDPVAEDAYRQLHDLLALALSIEREETKPAGEAA